MNVFIYVNLPTKISLNTRCDLVRLFYLPAVVSPHMWTPFSTVPLCNMRSILMEPFAMSIADGSHVSGKKIQMGMQRTKFQRLVTPHDEISSLKISLSFFTILLPRKFLQTFSNAFQALIFVAFNYVLMPWSSNGCLICGRKQIPFFILTSLVMGNVCLK